LILVLTRLIKNSIPHGRPGDEPILFLSDHFYREVNMTEKNGKNRKKGDRKKETLRCYIQCKVQPGMFKDEFLAVFEGADPSAGGQVIKVQLFVDSALVQELKGRPERGREVDGMLLVEVIKRTHEWALIALPQPAIPVGPTAVVRDSNLALIPG
jgi:hypothetical protein